MRVGETRASVFERHPRLFTVLLMVTSSLGTDVAFTWFHHWLSPHPRAAWASFRAASPVFHHGFRPLTSVDHDRWGPRVASYRIDSLGLRDATARQLPLASDRRRIVFIGDSFTEGIGLDWEKSFVGLVASALEKEGVEVLNAACVSYCPIIYYRKIKWLLDQGLTFDDIVVFMDMGDIQDEVCYRLDREGNLVPEDTRRIWEERENIRYALPPLLQNLSLQLLLKKHTTVLFALYELLEDTLKTDDRRAALWTIDPGLYEAFGREGLRNAEKHMDLLCALLRPRGIRLTVAVYPWPDQIRHHDLASVQVAFWRQWAADHGAGFIDYFPSFVRPEARDALARNFIRGDIHWNEAGHEVVAAGFRQYWKGANLDRRASAASAGSMKRLETTSENTSQP
jgi:hypothetical protein